jgi:hypothetical protein
MRWTHINRYLHALADRQYGTLSTNRLAAEVPNCRARVASVNAILTAGLSASSTQGQYVNS